MVRGGDTLLSQMAVNLMTNTVKIHGRGRIRVRAKPVGNDSRHVQLRVEVQDTGIGVGPARQAALFTSFAPHMAKLCSAAALIAGGASQASWVTSL